VTHAALALTTYSGERDRARGPLLADALIDCYARRGLRVSLLLRGSAGFGVKHHMRSDRLLTLSEDLPLVTLAIDRPEPLLAAADEAVGLAGDGLITLERVLIGGPVPDTRDPYDETKLTVFLGRGARVGGRPAHIALVDLLRRHGVAGATTMLGVDGAVHGRRRRARFAGANGHVPLLVFAVGDAAAIAAALPALDDLLGEPARILERVRVCKRDGVHHAPPHDLGDDGGIWRKLTVICGEQARHAGRPLADALVAGLRASGATGATAMRGIWGYHGDHEPHGDRLVQLRRRVPVVITTVDEPERSARSFALIDELTDREGLVLSERVPAFRARGAGIAIGGLELADPAGPA
jgi:PII-like signaling protein